MIINNGMVNGSLRVIGKLFANDIEGNFTNINGYTINASVPSGAKFTDTTYSVATTSANGL